MAMGLLWLLNAFLSVFLVEIENENTEADEKQQKESKLQKLKHNEPIDQSCASGEVTPVEVFAENKKKVFCPSVFLTWSCFWFVVYGFFHYSGMMGAIVLLPALLAESFLSNRSESGSLSDGHS